MSGHRKRSHAMISGRGNKGERSGFGDKGIEALWLWVDLNRAEFGGPISEEYS